jgi:hypothetical protein
MYDWSYQMRRKWILRLLLTIALLFSTPFIWWGVTAARQMRESEIPGRYSCEGPWGRSTLILKPDHTFSQAVVFTNQFNGRSEGGKTISGVWECPKHTLWRNDIEISPFVELAPLREQVVVEHFQTSYAMMLFAPVITIDPGVGIYYSK